MEDNLPKSDNQFWYENQPNHNEPLQPQPEPAPAGPPIQITENKKYSEKNDPPMVDVKVTNPVSYFKKWVKHLLGNEGIDIGFKFKVKPLTAIALMVALAVSFGTGYGTGLNAAAGVLFPNSSPLLHRTVMYQGNLQKAGDKYLLILPNSDTYTLKPKSNTNINFQNLTDGPVLVKGNLTREAFVIEPSEVISLGGSAPEPQATLTPTNSSISNPTDFPSLYPSLTWEVTQEKVLIFTSGKRKIEQNGVYLESAQVPTLPQDFLNYYTNELQTKGFEETLNSKDPEGTTITFAKNDLYLTFGIKNIFKGSGDTRQLSGYKAFIEHN